MKQSNYDIVIVGAGLIGLTLAYGLGRAGIRTAIIERNNLDSLRNKSKDGRVIAIAKGSKDLLGSLGVWQDFAGEVGGILDIRVVDNHSPLYLHFDHDLVSDEPMGYMAEIGDMLTIMLDKVEQQENIDILSETCWQDITAHASHSEVTLDNGDVIKTPLLVAVDGRNSQIRKYHNIATREKDCKQTAMVFNVGHELDHAGVAVEHFYPSGPFAILPMKGGHHSSIVWTEKRDLADVFYNMPADEFLEQVKQRFGAFLGEINIVTEKFKYPLGFVTAANPIADRLVLIGDAAHAIHPIAGQGYNLGMRDVEALLATITHQNSLGLDLGSNEILKEYAASRQYDVNSMTMLTDGLNNLFSNDITPVKQLRRVGLAAVNKIIPLKKFLMRNAMGLR